MAEQELTTTQTAATVIVALGTDKESQIYQYMNADEQERRNREAASLENVTQATTHMG